MKSILIVTDNNLSTVGGEQESTKIIIDGLRNEFSTSLFQPGRALTPFNGVKIYGFGDRERIKDFAKNPFRLFFYCVSLLKCLRKGGFDVVHTQAQVSFFAVSLLLKLRLVKGFKFIHTERGLYSKYGFFIRSLFCFFMSELDVLVATTKLNRDMWKRLVDRRGFSLDLRVIENTAGPLFESPVLVSKDDKGGHGLVVGFAGRYCEWKNWPLACDIVRRLEENNPDVGFTVKMRVGCLDEESEKRTKEMFYDIKSFLGDRFCGKINVPLREMEEFYCDVDMFCLTSYPGTESFGRTAVEAMSRECVVLTTPGGGPVEVIDDSSLVCDNAKQFAEVMSYYLKNPAALRDKGEANAVRARTVYSSEKNINEHRVIYSS